MCAHSTSHVQPRPAAIDRTLYILLLGLAPHPLPEQQPAPHQPPTPAPRTLNPYLLPTVYNWPAAPLRLSTPPASCPCSHAPPARPSPHSPARPRRVRRATLRPPPRAVSPPVCFLRGLSAASGRGLSGRVAKVLTVHRLHVGIIASLIVSPLQTPRTENTSPRMSG